ncbi:hypothetical protein JCM10908_006868 [Rhodotorula pacifica]|uniref:uncharacterized protein n=1 Tax=Rhodotorula pacifica TaxID=1495444 RepID=UPI00317DE923
MDRFGGMQSFKRDARPDETGDDEVDLRNVPPAFLRDVLVKLAPRILAGADSTTPQLPNDDDATGSRGSQPPQLPRSLSCTFSPPPHLPKNYALPPTHILSLTFGAGETSTTQLVIVPMHQLVWSVRCKRIARLVSLATADAGAISYAKADLYRWGARRETSPSPSTSSAAGTEAGPAETAATSSKHADTAAGGVVELPVISFPTALPAAALSTFSLLHTYLHTTDLPYELPPADSTPEDPHHEDDEDCASDCSSDDDDDAECTASAALAYTRQCEGLWRMCQSFGIADSDPIYEWLSPRWQAAVQRAAAAESGGGGAASSSAS